jgi:hypothetical protein
MKPQKEKTMNKLLVALSLGLGLAANATAQTPPRRVQAPTSRFSIDTPIVQLIANPAAKAALDRHMPNLSSHPQLAHFQNQSIRALAASPHASIPAARVQALQAELVRIR